MPASLLAFRQTVWLPLNETPAIQDVTKTTAYFTIIGSVTDMDAFQNNLNLEETRQFAGNEGDVSIAKNFTPFSVNKSFDPTTGKREETCVLKNNSFLID